MMLRYYLALLVLFSNSTWGQDSMSLITEGEYRPLYLSADSPLMKVSAFLLDKKPVTNRDFYQFLSTNIQWQRDMVPLLFAENSYLSHWQKIDDQYTPKSEDLEKPVVFVSWYAAQAYCASQQKRLVTVAEWEYAAQASTQLKNGSQDKLFYQKILDWYAKAAYSTPPNVGEDEPNYWGVHNLHGAIWEWTDDFNSELISGESRGDSSINQELYCATGSAGAVDPSNYAAFMRYAFRSSLNAKFTIGSLGFRCAQDGKNKE